MKLRPNERDYYVLEIVSDPELEGQWEMSIDDGAEWKPGVFSGGQWSWLVAGPDFKASDHEGMSDEDTVFTITESVAPTLRNADNPVLDVQTGPRISLVPIT